MSNFNFQVIHLSSTTSTNIHALDLLQQKKVGEGHIVWADYQEKGKGMMMESWHSKPAKNLLFSLVIEPNLEIEKRFELSKIAALGVQRYLDTLTVGKVEIKWPNDILIEGEKIAGVLIENSIVGNKIGATVIGVGINVNQTEFPSFPRAATSIKLRNGVEQNIEEILMKVAQSIYSIYQQLLNNNKLLHKEYLKVLYHFGIESSFEDKDGKFVGIIKSVQDDGKLQIARKEELKNYDLKEIKLLD